MCFTNHDRCIRSSEILATQDKNKSLRGQEHHKWNRAVRYEACIGSYRGASLSRFCLEKRPEIKGVIKGSCSCQINIESLAILYHNIWMI